RNLHHGPRWWGPASHHCFPRSRLLAYLEPEDQFPDRLGQRTHRSAADLHHERRRLQRAAADRWRVRDFALMVAQWAVPHLCLEPQIWPRSAGGQDIYIMDIASKHWVQLTHEQGANDFPSW